MNQCPNCGAGLRPGAVRCVKCGSLTESAPSSAAPSGQPQQVVYVAPRAEAREPWIAFVLSLVVSGLGQLYNGQLAKGIVFFVGAGFAWFFCLGWAVHVVAAIEAYQSARSVNRGAQP